MARLGKKAQNNKSQKKYRKRHQKEVHQRYLALKQDQEAMSDKTEDIPSGGASKSEEKPSYEVTYPEPDANPTDDLEVTGSGFQSPSDSGCASLESRQFKPVSFDAGDDGGDLVSDIQPVVTKGKEDSDFSFAPVEKKKEPATATAPASKANCEGGSYSTAGMRGYQEDRFTVDDKVAFYGVYDGHGGDKASRYCEKHMKEKVMEKINELDAAATDDDYENAFKEAFIEIDEKFLEKRDDDGCTACVGYVANDGKTSKLYVANVGDSRAIVVCADHSVVEMSQDHKPYLPSEKKRIEAAYHDVEEVSAILDGKRIKIARVDGVLAVSRAIGDGSLKDMTEPEKCAVTCVPEVRICQIDPEKHRFIVVACDGIWDVYSNEEVAEIVMDILGGKKKPYGIDELNRAARFIVDGAIQKGSADNCTAVVVAL